MVGQPLIGDGDNMNAPKVALYLSPERLESGSYEQFVEESEDGDTVRSFSRFPFSRQATPPLILASTLFREGPHGQPK